MFKISSQKHKIIKIHFLYLMKEKIITDDGSFSLFDTSLNEYYHSKKGAYSESIHVYIKNGVDYWLNNNPEKKTCRIFELGFGTGLNALATKRYAESNNLKVNYFSIEKYPLTNFQTQLIKPKHLSISERQIYNSSWNNELNLSPFFSIKKIHDDFFKFNFTENYDVIFYDAFAFHAQPLIWNNQVLKKSIDALNKKGVWVTYSSKADVRRALESFNVDVSKVCGFFEKREMLRVIKN